MPNAPIQFRPGTDKNPQETETSSLAFTDTNNVHFPDGRLRTVDPWSDVTPAETDVLGGARTIFGHIDDTSIYYLFGTSTRLYVIKNDGWFNITPLQTTTTAIPNSIDTTSGSAVVTINRTAHGLTTGDRIKISGSTGVGGIHLSEINKEHIITVVDVDSFTITVGANALSTVSGGGGGSVVMNDPIASGNLDQSVGSGYGLGRYGVGLYGVAKIASGNILQYPRIWSFDSFGSSMIMCPGDYDSGDGQKIYIWDGDTAVAPTVLTNAPTDCNYVFVYNNAVVALCGNRVDISKVGDATVWTPASDNNAFSVDIERTQRIISGTKVGNAAIIFTENEALYIRWVNEPEYYIIDDLFQSDGLIGPNAFSVMEQDCFWMGKRGWYNFNGSTVRRINNPQNEDFILDNLNNGQQWKTFAATDTKYNQIWFYYPDDASDEPNSYVILNLTQGHWTLGLQARTAMMRNNFVGSRFYGIYGDSTSQPASVYRHFLKENDSLTIAPYAETSFGMIGEGDQRFRINRVMLDAVQNGDLTVKMITKRYPQSSAESQATYTATPTTEYLNTRVSGRVRKYRFEQNSAGASFTLGDPKEQVTGQGLR